MNSSANYNYAPCSELESRHVQALRDYGLDVAVLENEPSTFTRSTHRNIHHASLGSNYVVGEQQSKRRVRNRR